MQKLIIAEPYRFVPPYPGRFWMNVFRYYLAFHLRRNWGLAAYEFRGSDHLRHSLAAGHGIILAPNHSRPFDPLVLGLLGIEVEQPFFTMASWHLFKASRFQGWLIRRIGAFSIYREGVDREALRSAIHILVTGQRPLVMMPEGIVTRTNDRLGTLQEGVAFLARSAAKQRAKATPPGHVVVHPVALKYFFEGDLAATVTPVLEEIEFRLSWRPQRERPLVERIIKVGEALLSIKEIEYLGQAQSGTIAERQAVLLDRLLVPLEKEWLNGQREPSTIERVKRLRAAIVPDLVTKGISDEEKARRWQQLVDCYLAQQIACYPPDYLNGQPSPERLLETVERFEEDLTDVARIHRPLRVVVQVGPALEVSPEGGKGGDQVLMKQLEESLRGMIEDLCQMGRTPANGAKAAGRN
jgi:1-acyl-sn-glycerol-3-phosphate acyltransferase